MRKLFRKLRREESGQSMVELAITLPVLILVLCAIIDFGFLFFNQVQITNFSREGARYGAVNATQANAITLIQNKVLGFIPTKEQSKYTVTVTLTSPSTPRSGDVVVSIELRWKAMTPITGVFYSGQTIKLYAKCTMKVE